MAILKDVTGKIFSRLTVIKRAPNNKHGHIMWLCKCICGKEKIIQSYSLRSGDSTSCGCFAIEQIKLANTKHSHALNKRKDGSCTKTYNAWCGIKKRCNNPCEKDDKDYRSRGIFVCELWSDFANFLEDMGEKPEGLEIDRIDNNDGYYKENCRWVTKEENGSNKRNNVWITHDDGRRHTLAQWSRIIGRNPQTIKNRLERGWPVNLVLTPDKLRYKH